MLRPDRARKISEAARSSSKCRVRPGRRGRTARREARRPVASAMAIAASTMGACGERIGRRDDHDDGALGNLPPGPAPAQQPSTAGADPVRRRRCGRRRLRRYHRQRRRGCVGGRGRVGTISAEVPAELGADGSLAAQRPVEQYDASIGAHSQVAELPIAVQEGERDGRHRLDK